MEDGITWVGLDAHKATIQVTMLLPGGAAPVEWQVANEPGAWKPALGAKVYVTKRRFAAPSAQSVTAEVAAVTREAAANRG